MAECLAKSTSEETQDCAKTLIQELSNVSRLDNFRRTFSRKNPTCMYAYFTQISKHGKISNWGLIFTYLCISILVGNWWQPSRLRRVIARTSL